MKLKYGTYTHDANEAGVRIRREPLHNEGGIRIGYTEIWDITGELQAADAATLSTTITTFKTAFSSNAQDLKLLFDDLTVTSHTLLTDDCFGGTRVVSGPSFPNYEGSEYVNRRSFAMTIEGDVLTQVTNQLMAFSEILTFSGGGPLTLHIELDVGPPQKQQTRDQTTYRVTQAGAAIGLFTWPNIPPPIWPDAEVQPQRQVTYKNPRRIGPTGAPEYRDFEATWSYQFESTDGFVGEPNRWI